MHSNVRYITYRHESVSLKHGFSVIRVKVIVSMNHDMLSVYMYAVAMYLNHIQSNATPKRKEYLLM